MKYQRGKKGRLALLIGSSLLLLITFGLIIGRNSVLADPSCFMTTEDGATTDLTELCEVIREEENTMSNENREFDIVVDVEVDLSEPLSPGSVLPGGAIYVSAVERIHPTGIRQVNEDEDSVFGPNGEILSAPKYYRPDGSRILPGEKIELQEGETIIVPGDDYDDPDIKRFNNLSE